MRRSASVSSIARYVFSFDATEKVIAERILSGINSGIWKYWCYSNDALNKTSQQIFEKDQTVGSLLSGDYELPSDHRSEWDKIITDVGEFLYEVAYFISEALNALKATDMLSVSDGITETNEKNIDASRKSLFASGCYYNKNTHIKELRHTIEAEVQRQAESNNFKSWCENRLLFLKSKARSLLDMCNLVLENNIPVNKFFEKTLVVHSPTGTFPNSLDQTADNELYLDGINDKVHTRLFGCHDEKEVENIVTDIQADAKIAGLQDCEFLLVKSSNPFYGSYTGSKLDKKSKGSELVENVNSIVKVMEQQSKFAPNENCQDFISSLLKIVDTNNSVNLIVFQSGSKIIINSGNGTIIDEPNNSSISIDFCAQSDQLEQELCELRQKVKEISQQNAIDEAVVAIRNQDESKFKRALKSVVSFARDVLTNTTASVLFQYMMTNGLLP